MILLGISGRARAGKDTLANYLMEELKGYGMIKTAFAKELKDQVAKNFDMSHDQMYGNLKEVSDERYTKEDHIYNSTGSMVHESYWTPREILQDYGQFMRTVDRNYWVNALLRKLKRQGVNFAVAPDVRHINEVDIVHEKGGLHIRIYRESDEVNAVHNQQHISETALDEYGNIDFEVDNNGTLDDLGVIAQELANKLKEKYKEELHNG